MGFLKRLFGSSNRPYVDTQGVYFYVRCDNCNAVVRLRADKQHDLNREPNGFVWHKTIVDSRCFRPMRTVVHLDSGYHVTDVEIEGGHYISEAAYHAALAAPAPQDAVPDDNETETEETADD